MTMTHPYQTLEIRRKKLYFRACHRGMKELDIVLGNFANHHLPTMNEAQLDAFEQLMMMEEPKLFAFITGAQPIPEEERSEMLNAVLNFINHATESA